MKNAHEILNDFYKPLHLRANNLCKIFNSSGIKAVWAFYNGHFVKDGDGWTEEFFPIPVISIDGLCDVEIHSDKISVSAKLKRAAALKFDYSLLDKTEFEMYGVENYLEDIYNSAIPVAAIRENISACREKEIGFSFNLGLPHDEEILSMVKILKTCGFYY